LVERRTSEEGGEALDLGEMFDTWCGVDEIWCVSERSPALLRYATKKARMISEVLIIVQDNIYRQPGPTLYTDTKVHK
jgi:hypothetical protein